jgi:hypothetical protein
MACHIPYRNARATPDQAAPEMIMRPTSTYPAAAAFLPEAASADRAPHTLLATLWAMLLAVRDGLSAAHDYQQLTARGMAPEAAARRVFADHFEAR